jgi:predicted nucleotidyltransferase
MQVNIAEVLSDKVSSYDAIVFGYLFGSYAKNVQTSQSDIDIALFLKDTSLDAQLQLTYELSKFLKKDVDLVVLNTVRNLYLLEVILNEGVVIKDHEDRFDFELMKQHEILDFKAFRKYIDAA